MDRRTFLKLAGLITAATAMDVAPVAAAGSPQVASAEPIRARDVAVAPSVARLMIREPGTYRISGVVRLEEPLVEIGGITNTQWISWSDAGGSELPTASFTTFEYVERSGMAPNIRIRGGRLEALSAIRMDFE